MTDDHQPAPVSVEEIARTIAMSYGVDPDDLAPLSVMTDAENRPVAWWNVYAEQAQAIIALLPHAAPVAVSRVEASAAPPGWKLVPLDPDETMLRAANKASLSTAVLMDDTRFACERATYVAAVAAAPTPPGEPK